MTTNKQTNQTQEEIWRTSVERTATNLLEKINDTIQSKDKSQATLSTVTTYSHDRISLITDLHKLVEYAIEFSAMEWEEGDDCPHCGSDKHMRLVEETEAVIYYEDGNSKSKGAHPTKTTYGYECFECRKCIKLSPKSFLLDNVCDMDIDIPALKEALTIYASEDGKLRSEDWEGGDKCLNPNCQRKDTQQSTVFSEVFGDGTYVDSINILCKSCLEPLWLSEAAGLPNTFALNTQSSNDTNHD